MENTNHSGNQSYKNHNSPYQPPLADMGVRVLAFIIDSTIVGFISFAVTALVGVIGFLGFSSVLVATSANSNLPVFGLQLIIQLLSLVARVLIPCAYSAFFLPRHGATPGKMIFNLVVIHAQTGRYLNTQEAAIRGFVKIISGAVLGIGLFWAFFNDYRQSWHDLASNTFVISMQPAVTTAPVSVNVQTEPYNNSI